jgi:hypothetical protein
MTTRKYAAAGLLLSAASALGLAAMTSSASADIITMTYTGSVSSVNYTGTTWGQSYTNVAADQLNFFGGGNLAGDAFTVVFTFDTSKGTLTNNGGSLGSGASGDGVFSPTLITIGSITQSLYQGSLDSATGAATGFDGVHNVLQNGVFAQIGGAGANFGISTGGANSTAVAPDQFTTDSTVKAGCGFCGTVGSFNVGGEDIEFTVAQEVTFDTSTAVTSGVPEASTWAMMMLGFVGIGAMTYRRRKGAALAA